MLGHIAATPTKTVAAPPTNGGWNSRRCGVGLTITKADELFHRHPERSEGDLGGKPSGRVRFSRSNQLILGYADAEVMSIAKLLLINARADALGLVFESDPRPRPDGCTGNCCIP